MRFFKRFAQSQEAFILPTILSFIVVAIILAAALVEVIDTNLSIVNNNVQSQQAFNIAEAGINYYLWHLSHNPTDFKDGQSTPTTPDPTLGYGPYVHNYIDSNAVNEGTFTLWIKPQGGGSTVATVQSTGQVKNSKYVRTIQAQIGEPSFASYGVLGDSALWFGNDETADGPIGSNQGIRMDGPNTDTVSSANTTYVPSTALGGDGHTSEPGVWCSSSVTSPVNCNTRSKTNWLFPVSAVDFNQVNTSLCSMKKIAFASYSSTASLANQANACTQTPSTRTAAYLPQRSSSFSLTKGYLINLNTNGTYDLYNVNGENDRAATYSSALTTQLVASGIVVPSSGVIFAEDNVWIRSNPTFHGRVTIGSGRLASSNNTDIVISDDLLYSTKNGQDAIGLVAEGDVLVAPYAPPASGSFNYEIDAAILSENGNVEYPVYYRTASSRCTHGWVNSNQQLIFYGSVSTRQTWTWNWLVGSACGDAANDPVNGWVSGIEHTVTSYDYNMLYSPPPSYPLTAGFNILSWREVLTKP
ncbi:MAG TPA: type II secretion system protein [Candidatus Nitrosopolaris sp.]|nr:type II secretion system protein [Candidatus Nitrosopolaris sp.]